MPIYRYSQEGIARIERQVRNKTLAFSGAALLAGFGITIANAGTRQIASTLPVFAIGAAILFWTQRRSAGRVRQMLEATEFELTETELIGRSPAITTTTRPEDVAELKYMRDGIFVRTRGLRNSPLLKPELAGFDELAARLERWVPPGVRRTQAESSSVGRWTTAATLTSLAMMAAALTTTDPLIAITCCLATSALLIFCVVWVWRSQIDRRTKRMMLICVLPVVSLLARAYALAGNL